MKPASLNRQTGLPEYFSAPLSTRRRTTRRVMAGVGGARHFSAGVL